MSDFDKEAERERLREKYERDEQKREVTERMSELLLKGATMTNAHCQDCGDPIFRYDGQEFCATCQKAVERDTGREGDEAAEDDSSSDAETNGDREEIEVARPSEARVRFGAEDQPSDEAAPSDEDTHPPETAPPHQPHVAPDPQGASASSGDLREAHASLVRTITHLAQQAEASDDLGQTRALLEATREAAEALAAVREAGR